MPSLFQSPRWDRLRPPKSLELSKQAEDIQSAASQTPLFPQGFRVVPGHNKSVSLQSLGTPINARGPSLVGPSETLIGRAAQSAPGERGDLLKALKSQQKGFQFGAPGSLAATQTPSGFMKPLAPATGFIPPSADKPVLSGGVPLVPHSPVQGLEVEADDIQFGGFSISGTGEIATAAPTAPALGATGSLAPSEFLEEPALGADILDELDPANLKRKAQSKSLIPVAPMASLGAFEIPQLSVPVAPPALAVPLAPPTLFAPPQTPEEIPGLIEAGAPISAFGPFNVGPFNLNAAGYTEGQMARFLMMYETSGVVPKGFKASDFSMESGGGGDEGGAGDAGGDTGGDAGGEGGDDSGGDDGGDSGGDDGGGDDGGGDDGGDF